MKTKDLGPKIFKIIFAACIVTFVMVIIGMFLYWNGRMQQTRMVDERMKTETITAAEKIGAIAAKAESAVDMLAAQLAKGDIQEDHLAAKIKEMVSESPGIYDIGVAFAPEKGPDGDLYKSIRCIKKGKDAYIVHGDPKLDYTHDAWYRPSDGLSGKWTEPYRSKTVKNLIVSYSRPFVSGGRKGVVYVSVSINTIRQIASIFKFGDTGYCIMLSREGHFIYHPVKEAAERQKTIFEMAKSGKGTVRDKEFIETTRRALAGEDIKVHLKNPVTGQQFCVSYKGIGNTGWALGAIFFDDEIRSGEDGFRKKKMWIALCLVIFLTFLSALIFRVTDLSTVGLWALSGVFSALCLAATFYIWHLAIDAPLVEENKNMVFTDAPSLNRFVEENAKSYIDSDQKPPYYVPTGIFIQSLEFSSSNDLKASGYVWQKYLDGVHDSLGRGFVMPEASDISIREDYRYKTGKEETIGWYFEATIRETFDYSKYPFDRPNIWIWLKHKDVTQNVVLVPDLAAYKFITPYSMPGLQEDLAFPGYVFLGSFFDYEYHIRRSNLGISKEDQPDRTPQLFYNIIVRRNFVTPFVARLFPLFIMFAILFIVQLMFSSDEEKKKAFGLNAFAVMGVVITFFFSTLLSQNSLRQELSVEKIIFIEYFHFIAYMMLLLATVKTLLFIGGKNIKFVQYKQGLIPKLLYWPFFAVMIYIVTFMSFYN